MEALVDCASRPELLDDVPIWFEGWEQVLSRFRLDSELTQLNRRAGQKVPVSQPLWDVLQASLEAEKLTDGLVNPLILDALQLAGYDQSFENLRLDTPGFFSGSATNIVSVRDISVDVIGRTVCLPGDAQLDFGGIAKGWAANQAVERLKAAGPALVNAGGDIAISGPEQDGTAWPIGVENPFQRDTELEILYIECGGLATSGKDYHRWMRNGIQLHHIIDPRTGLPAETDILSATVIAATAVKAEAMAKAVLISGSQAGLAKLDDDINVAGLLVLENGDRLYSRNMERFLNDD